MKSSAPITAVTRVLEALDAHGCAPRRSGRGWQAPCPAHEDHNPSLAISEGRDGRAMLHCFADCELSQILEALGLQASDLFAREPASHLLERGARATCPPSIPAPRTDARPPRDEIQAVWNLCQPLDLDLEAAAWAAGRRLDRYTIADRDLCRALPSDATVPRWASLGGRSWPVGGYRIVLPMYDPQGMHVSLHARNVRPGVAPKGALPAGFAARGLVLADITGRLMLRTGSAHGPVWLTEGAPDFMICACGWGDAAEDSAPAVLGILAGSWSPEVAARIPDGARVVIGVHHDHAGEKYLATIAKSLAGRCVLERWSPPTVTP